MQIRRKHGRFPSIARLNHRCWLGVYRLPLRSLATYSRKESLQVLAKHATNKHLRKQRISTAQRSIQGRHAVTYLVPMTVRDKRVLQYQETPRNVLPVRIQHIYLPPPPQKRRVRIRCSLKRTSTRLGRFINRRCWFFIGGGGISWNPHATAI